MTWSSSSATLSSWRKCSVFRLLGSATGAIAREVRAIPSPPARAGAPLPAVGHQLLVCTDEFRHPLAHVLDGDIGLLELGPQPFGQTIRLRCVCFGRCHCSSRVSPCATMLRHNRNAASLRAHASSPKDALAFWKVALSSRARGPSEIHTIVTDQFSRYRAVRVGSGLRARACVIAQSCRIEHVDAAAALPDQPASLQFSSVTLIPARLTPSIVARNACVTGSTGPNWACSLSSQHAQRSDSEWWALQAATSSVCATRRRNWRK